MALLWVKEPSAEVKAAFEALYAKAPEVVKRVDVHVKVKKGSLGLYQWQASRRRIICPPSPLIVAAHELGHHAHSWCLNWGDWPEWWKANKSLMPNDRARESDREGFAEVFGWWLLGKGLDAAVKAKLESYWT